MADDPKFTGKGWPGNRRNRYEETEYAENTGATIRRLASYFSGETVGLAAVFFVIVAGTASGVIAPLFQSRAVDIIAGTDDGDLTEIVLIMLAFYLLYSLCQLLQGLLSVFLGQRLIRKIREELFSKIVSLPVRYADTHSRGDIMSRMTNDIDNISITVSQSLPSLLSGTLTIIATSVAMILCCPELALLSLSTIILSVIATRFISGLIRKYSRRRQAVLGRLNGFAEEMIAGYRTVVSCNHQEKACERFGEVSDSLTKAGILADACSGVMGPVMNCIGNVRFVIIAVFGGWFALHGMVSLGIISAFIVYAGQFSRPVNELALVWGQLQTAVAGAERVFRVLDEEDEDMSGKMLPEGAGSSVVFENVCFAYEKGRPVLNDFSLYIPAGGRIALVGPTGCGKTTVVNLLMRFYDPGSGRILIDGRDITEISRGSLRRNTAIILQDTVLFSDTVENNIRYGNENATPEMIDAAVEAGCCREMVEAFPEGLQTILKGSGAGISQGQRQLLSIARAFTADPKILILDEATSGIDTRTEKAVQDAMQHAMRSRTAIVIAHRLSTIRNADMIVVMDEGKIVERGTHEKLMDEKGKYYELYMMQYAGFETRSSGFPEKEVCCTGRSACTVRMRDIRTNGRQSHMS